MSLDVLFFEARALGGETVGPREDSELFSKGTSDPSGPLGCVVGAGVAHKADLEVERREGGGEVRDAGGGPEPPADTVGHACAQSVMGDEEHAALDLTARYGLSDVMQQASGPEPVTPLLTDPRTDSLLGKFPLHATHCIQNVIQGVEVIERPLSLVLGKPKLRHLAHQRLDIERGESAS